MTIAWYVIALSVVCMVGVGWLWFCLSLHPDDKILVQPTGKASISRMMFSRTVEPFACTKREEKEVQKLVQQAYRDDPEYEPVLTRVGEHQWEVNELRPRGPYPDSDPVPMDSQAELDPYFTTLSFPKAK
jgi:hypothetical protein